MKTQTKANITIGIIIAIFFGRLAFNSYNDKQQLNKNGVYLIGVKYKYESGGNRGGVSYYEYYYNNKRYEFGIRDGGVSNSQLFFIVLPSNPDICRALNEVEVPPCLTIKNVPKTGWREMPVCQ